MSRRKSSVDRLDGPVVVVDHRGGGRPVEVDELAHLGADPLHPLVNEVLGVEVALAGLLGIADQAGRAADEGQGPVPGSCIRRIVRICTRLPMCRLGAVGSKPQYALSSLGLAEADPRDSEVVASTSPRSRSTSTTLRRITVDAAAAPAGAALAERLRLWRRRRRQR
jgi:hypothetical protein